MKALLLAAVVAAAVGLAGAASSATFSYSTDFSAGVGPEWNVVGGVNTHAANIAGEFGNVSAILTRNSPGAGSGSLTFDLLGFRTLDGNNSFSDTFHLIINGSEVLRATFGLGGGGGDFTYLSPAGTSITGTGQVRTITLPFNVVAHNNVFEFTYSSLQDFSDEGWGLDNVSFTAEVSDPHGNPVPEPATWAMMIGGFAGMGAMLRRRRALATA